MGESLVRVDRDGAVAVITLDRPEKRNALSIALRDAVSDAFDQLGQDETASVAVLTGSGDSFSAGFDLAEFADDELAEQLWASSDRFHHTILRCPIPTIAAVNGPALAGGFDLACLCDIRIASATARFAHPEHRWATVLYRTLHDLVGGATARDLVLTGRELDAAQALAIGLVAEVVSPDALFESALARAQSIAQAPRSALVATKRKIIAAAGIDRGLTTLDI